MTDTVDLEACVRMLTRIERSFSATSADAATASALKAALPGMGKDSERLRAENIALLNILCTVRDHVFIADPEMLEADVEWLDREIAARAAQPEERSADGR